MANVALFIVVGARHKHSKCRWNAMTINCAIDFTLLWAHQPWPLTMRREELSHHTTHPTLVCVYCACFLNWIRHNDVPITDFRSKRASIAYAIIVSSFSVYYARLHITEWAFVASMTIMSHAQIVTYNKYGENWLDNIRMHCHDVYTVRI